MLCGKDKFAIFDYLNYYISISYLFYMMQVDSKLSRCISIKIPIMKKKAMHLPILSLQTDSKVRKRVKKNQEIKIATDRKEKRSVS